MREVKGNLLLSDVSSIGHGVNIHGVMGAGIAVAFKENFPTNYSIYRDACENDSLVPGHVLVTHENNKYVFNIASQDKPGPHAREEWLEAGLIDSLRLCDLLNENELGLPLIGGGIGGIDPDRVVSIMKSVESKFSAEIVLHVL